MKLKQYIKKLQKLADKYPDVAVIYSSDDEGNGYSFVQYDPSVGEFKNGYEFDNELVTEFNAVCLN
jgi:UDP-N-acetylglucosamine 2-epimerase